MSATSGHDEQGDPGQAEVLDPTIDTHRFSSEPRRRRGGKTIVTVFLLLSFVLAVIGVGGWLAKTKYAQYMAERTEKQRTEREKSADNTRRGRQFVLDAPLPGASAPAVAQPATAASSAPARTASAALPAGFGAPKEPPNPAIAVLPLTKPLASAAPAGGDSVLKAPVATPRPRHSMMVDDDAAEPATPVAHPAQPAAPASPVLAVSPPAKAAAVPARAVGAAPAGVFPGVPGLNVPGMPAAGAAARALAAAATGNAPLTMATGAIGAQSTEGPPPANVQEMAHQKAAKMPLTNTQQSVAAKLGNRSLLLARGSYIPCVLETDLNSNVPGPSSCIVTENIYSDDGRVLLIDKGTRVQGEYRATMKQGDTRIAVLWQRIKTPLGVVVDVDSPAAEGTGAVGVEGLVDNHWMQRIGGAFLLSMVQDVVAAKTRNQANGGTVINTSNMSKSMAEKVLESTINIAPTLYKNRGERLMILVNRDLWFDSVYSVGKAAQ